MNFAARIAELQTQLAQAQEQLTTASAESERLAAELATMAEANRQCETRHIEDTAAIQQLTADLAAAATARDTAEQALAAERTSREAAISAEVTTRLAAAGVDPIKRDPKAKTDDTGKPKIDASAPARQRATAAMESSFKVFGKKD